jgi:hypothetical protein
MAGGSRSHHRRAVPLQLLGCHALQRAHDGACGRGRARCGYIGRHDLVLQRGEAEVEQLDGAA